MKKLSVGQRKILAEFFCTSAVAWLTAGVITPFFISRTLEDFTSFAFWGILFTSASLWVALTVTKGVKS